MGLGLRRRLRALKQSLPGYDRRNWLRIRQLDAWTEFLEHADPGSVLEISPAADSPWRRFGGYEEVHYPDFDICKDRLDRQFDVVIADQVLEHVHAPAAALQNIRLMVKPGGTALIATPFLFRVHARPYDFYRWTAEGLLRLADAAGFEVEENVHVESWGNKACAKAHIGGRVKDFAWGRDLSNDPEYPMMVWAYCYNR